MYQIDEVKQAIRLYHYLLEHGELISKSDDQELYHAFSNQKIRKLLAAFEEETNVTIRKFEDTIYLIPNPDNEFLGYKRQEIKNEIFNRSEARNIDLYLAMYILIHLTSEFYSGIGPNAKIRDLIEIGELDLNMTNRLEMFKDQDDKTVNKRTGLAMTDIAAHWFSLKNVDDEKALRSRRWYIDRVMNFLKREELVAIQDETVIIPTTKFNRLVQNYFLDFERLSDIQTILNEEGGVDNAENS